MHSACDAARIWRWQVHAPVTQLEIYGTWQSMVCRAWATYLALAGMWRGYSRGVGHRPRCDMGAEGGRYPGVYLLSGHPNPELRQLVRSWTSSFDYVLYATCHRTGQKVTAMSVTQRLLSYHLWDDQSMPRTLDYTSTLVAKPVPHYCRLPFPLSGLTLHLNL